MAKWQHLSLAILMTLTGCATAPMALAPQPANTAAMARRNTPARTVNVALKSGSLRQWAQTKRLRLVKEYPQINAGVIAAPEGADQLAASLKRDPAVRFATPDRTFSMPKPRRSRSGFSLLNFNDPQIPKQYSLAIMQVQEAWKLSRGKGVTVAVMDSGFDYDHPELKNQLLPGFNPYYGVAGRLFAGPSGGEHGTHVAGIIGAQGNNGLGIAGVAPEAKILPIKLWPDEDYEKVRAAVDPFYTEYVQKLLHTNEALMSALVGGVIAAAEGKADVLNMSLGMNGGDPNDLQMFYLAVDYAIKKGVTVLVAAGNERQEGNPQNLMALHPGSIAVGATDDQDRSAPFSQKHDYVSVSAPGVKVLSTVPATIQNATFAYEALDGTSMATPNVAGVVALIKAANPKLGPAHIKAILEKTADDLGPRGKDPEFGHGRVNAFKAVSVAKKL